MMVFEFLKEFEQNIWGSFFFILSKAMGHSDTKRNNL